MPKFKKWPARYVFDFLNGLVRRVTFPLGVYDADGLGESRRSIVYVVKSSQIFFRASEVSTVGSVKFIFSISWTNLKKFLLKREKNDQFLAFSIIKNDCGVLMTSKSFLCEA